MGNLAGKVAVVTGSSRGLGRAIARRLASEGASVVVITFPLQFLSLADRDRLVDRVYRGLQPGGLLLFSEKIVHADEEFSVLQQDFHHRFKGAPGTVGDDGTAGCHCLQGNDAEVLLLGKDQGLAARVELTQLRVGHPSQELYVRTCHAAQRLQL